MAKQVPKWLKIFTISTITILLLLIFIARIDNDSVGGNEVSTSVSKQQNAIFDIRTIIGKPIADVKQILKNWVVDSSVTDMRDKPGPTSGITVSFGDYELSIQYYIETGSVDNYWFGPKINMPYKKNYQDLIKMIKADLLNPDQYYVKPMKLLGDTSKIAGIMIYPQ